MPIVEHPARRRVATGFTLIEVLIVVGLAATLAAVAYPSFRSQLLKARRTDALIALMQMQQGQERWRSSHARYASADELASPSTSPNGHYRLQVSMPGPHGFELIATALAGQQDDRECRVLRIVRQDGQTRYLSTGDDTRPAAGSPAQDRRCWAR